MTATETAAATGRAWRWYLCIGLASVLAGDALSAMLWLGAYVLLGAAALHPSMTRAAGQT